MNVDVPITEEISIKEFAKKYYVEGVYPSFKDYCNEIEEVNNNKDFLGHYTPYQNVTIPLYVNKENVYVERIEELLEELKTLPEWVDYEIQYGDTIYLYDQISNKESEFDLDYKRWAFGPYHADRLYPSCDEKQMLMLYNANVVDLRKFMNKFEYKKNGNQLRDVDSLHLIMNNICIILN